MSGQQRDERRRTGTMNNPKQPFVPSTGSQPLSVATKTPVRRRAARCSQPIAAPEAELIRKLDEARWELAMAETTKLYWPIMDCEGEVNDLLMELGEIYERKLRGLPAGNTQVSNSVRSTDG